MSMNGKRDGFTLADFEACGKAASMKRGRAKTIVAETVAAVGRWREFAGRAGILEEWTEQIARAHRLKFAGR